MDGIDVGQGIELRYSHHVIEHLGLKLYQNKPTNVLAELVSNAWDAFARHVWIDLATQADLEDARFISVADDGAGMSLEVIRDEYLIIGKVKDRADAQQRARYPMGRKGIGKLAPFGIARVVDIVTIHGSGTERETTWIRLDLEEILRRSAAADPVVQSTYPPVILARGITPEAVETSDDATGAVAKFLTRIGAGTGTLVVLTDLVLLRKLRPEAVRESIGRRFTVTLTRPDFKVFVDDAQVSDAEALPKFGNSLGLAAGSSYP